MCKVVYLTSKRFDFQAGDFKMELAHELRKRDVEVVTAHGFDWLNSLRRHRTYGVALAFDFYRDNGTGCGLVLSKKCGCISRNFAYRLTDVYDSVTPDMQWRELSFVSSYNKEWYRFFNKVSATTKAIFYLCTATNPTDMNEYYTAREKVITLFADEIVRCLDSNYEINEYAKMIEQELLKKRRRISDGGMVAG